MAGTFNQSLQCTQDVFVGFQAPSPPVASPPRYSRDLPDDHTARWSTRKYSEAGGSLEGQVKVGFFSLALVIP